MPKVSIIVPTYNRASFLKATIESILSQDYADYEIIVTDNNSSDGTSEIVEQFKCSKIKYLKHSENLGLCKNYNTALELASGEYIQIFSDDDKMLSDCLSEKVSILDKFPNVGLVHSDINIINENDIIVSESHWAYNHYSKWAQTHSKSGLFTGSEYFSIFYYHWNIVSMPAVMFRRGCINKIGLFSANIDIAIDFDYWLRITPYFDFYYINKKLVSYRVHTNNNISKYSKEQCFGELVQMKKNLMLQSPNYLNKMNINKKNFELIAERQIKRYFLMNKRTIIYESEKIAKLLSFIN